LSGKFSSGGRNTGKALFMNECQNKLVDGGHHPGGVAFHPDGKAVSVMPIRLAKGIATLTRNKNLQIAADLMAYFDKIGKMGDPAETNAILGGPTLTLNDRIRQQQSQSLVKEEA
jgi:hypothetical protein